MNKKYRHVKGFKDSTDYILVDENNEIFRVDVFGVVHEFVNKSYTLKDIKKFVDNGVWEELKEGNVT